MKNLFFFALILGFCEMSYSQQLCDTSFIYELASARYPGETGPIVWIDEAHNNFHTKSGRYCGFAQVLEADGYQVGINDQAFDQAALKACDILVIANALDDETHIRNWNLPNRSAFSSAEIQALRDWVSQGGSLMLVADHMPFPGCSAELAAAFGFTFMNGYAMARDSDLFPSIFHPKNKSLLPHPITAGIPQIASFTGQAFPLPEGAEPLLQFGDDHEMIMVKQAGQLGKSKNPHFPITGWSQGAVMAFGRGRIAVFGEAAMFTSQSIKQANGQVLKFGFDAPAAPGNALLLRNTMAWLTGDLVEGVSEEIKTAIAKQNVAMEQGVKTGNMLTVAKIYTDDGLVISPGHISAKGRKEIDTYWEKFDGRDWRLDMVALCETEEELKNIPPTNNWKGLSPLGDLIFPIGN